MNSLIPFILKHVGDPNETPLFGNAKEFDCKHFSSLLSQELHGAPVSIHLRESKWTDPPDHECVTAIRTTPIEAQIYWSMSKTDRSKLLQACAKGTGKTKLFASSALEQGFYEFLLLNGLKAASECEPLQHLSLQLMGDSVPPEGKVFCVDVEIALKTSSVWGTLMITEEFRKQWIRHFAAFPPEIHGRLASTLEFSLGVQIGSVQLLQKEWKKVKVGDLIIPDVFDPKEPTSLTLFATPVFRVKKEHNKLTMIHPLFSTEDAMEENLSEEIVSVKDLPLDVHVELAQIRMTLGELLHLKAGHVLEMPPHVEERVTLTVNGKKIAHAELVTIGNGYALKIVDL